MAVISVAAIISTVATVASTVSSISASKKAKKARKNAERERREARSIQTASEKNINRINRRRVLREERVRRSRIIAAAEGRGAGGGSGSISAPGIVGTNVAAAIAAQSSGTKAAEGISSRLQSASDFQAAAAQATAQGKLFANIATGIGDIAGEIDIFKTTKPFS